MCCPKLDMEVYCLRVLSQGFHTCVSPKYYHRGCESSSVTELQMAHHFERLWLIQCTNYDYPSTFQKQWLFNFVVDFCRKKT